MRGAFKVKLRNEDSIWLGWKVIVKVFELGTWVSNLPRTGWRWELGKQGFGVGRPAGGELKWNGQPLERGER